MIECRVYVGDLLNHLGSKREIHLSIPGVGFSSALCSVIDDVECNLTLESVTGGIVVHGFLDGNYSAQCSYGLTDIVDSFHFNVNELFESPRERDKKIINIDVEGQLGQDDNYQFTGDELDLEQMFRDVIITGLPLAPVCAHGPENCSVCSVQIKKFISKRFDKSDEVIGGIDDVLNQHDPRWSALDDFKP
ncbi:MAG: YceD family protein [Acidimicrobiia bacterium]